MLNLKHPYLLSGGITALLAVATYAVIASAGSNVRGSQQPRVCAFLLLDRSGATTPVYMRYMVDETFKPGLKSVWKFGKEIKQDTDALTQLRTASELCNFEVEVHQ